jgi:hypothetical protein
VEIVHRKKVSNFAEASGHKIFSHRYVIFEASAVNRFFKLLLDYQAIIRGKSRSLKYWFLAHH